MAKVTIKVETTLQQRVDAKNEQAKRYHLELKLAASRYEKASYELDMLMKKLEKEVKNA